MQPNSRVVIDTIARLYETEAAALVGPAREAWLVEARDAALLLLVDSVGLRPSAACRRLGRLPDPVYLSRARVRYRANERFAARVDEARGILGGAAVDDAAHGG